LSPDGLLMLGDTESVQGCGDLYQEIPGGNGFYTRITAPVARLSAAI